MKTYPPSRSVRIAWSLPSTLRRRRPSWDINGAVVDLVAVQARETDDWSHERTCCGLPAAAADALRVYQHGDYLILYTLAGSTVYLLSIRHHRQLSFDFARIWEP